MISMATVHELTDTLTDLLSTWGTRDDSGPQPDVRRAGALAVATLDALTGELYTIRGTLVGEIRASDAATAVRVDTLLAQRPGGDR